MAAHVWAGIDWPVITDGPLTKAVMEQWAKRHWEGNEAQVSEEGAKWQDRKRDCNHPK